MKKTKRPKLVFGNHRCLCEWVQRVSISDDPDNDPLVLVKTAETGGDIATQHCYHRTNGYSYVRVHPSSSGVRKLESFGRVMTSYDLFKLSKFIGSKDRPFWLINYKGSDSMAGRCRSDLFRILTDGNGSLFKGTNQFAFVPDHLVDVMPSDIEANWSTYVQSFRNRIEDISKWTGRWIRLHTGLALQCVVDEYVQLGTYIGKQVSAQDLQTEVDAAKTCLTAKEVLSKLKEK